MENISLFCRCKKNILMLGLFTVLRVVTAFLFCITRGEIFALLCDLSACVMLTLFFDLFSFVLKHYLAENKNTVTLKYDELIFGVTDAAVFSLKLIFLFLPSVAVDCVIGIHIFAAAVDVLLSRWIINFTDPAKV